MLGRRFLLLVVVLMGLTALAATIAPRQPLIHDGARRTATPTPTPTVEATAASPVHEISRTLMITADPGRITVKQGTLLELTVKGDELGNLSLMDQVEPIERESPAIFDAARRHARRVPDRDGRRGPRRRDASAAFLKWVVV